MLLDDLHNGPWPVSVRQLLSPRIGSCLHGRQGVFARLLVIALVSLMRNPRAEGSAQEVVGDEEDAVARGPLTNSRRVAVLYDTSFLLVLSRHGQDTLLWLHPCGPAVDRLRRSTVGSGTCEDVASAFEMTVLLEVVYFSPVPAVIAVPALAALRLLRHRTSTCRVCSVFRLWVDEVSLGCRAERRAAR